MKPLNWRIEGLLSGASFGVFFFWHFTPEGFGWFVSGLLWLSWSMHDRQKEFEEQIKKIKESGKNEP